MNQHEIVPPPRIDELERVSTALALIQEAQSAGVPTSGPPSDRRAITST